jgi:hypothetical protein
MIWARISSKVMAAPPLSDNHIEGSSIERYS